MRWQSRQKLLVRWRQRPARTAELMASNITRPTNVLPVLGTWGRVPVQSPMQSSITVIAEKDLYAVEYNPKFCRDLRSRLPQSHIIEGNAFELDRALAHLDEQQFDCVISGLPLLNFDPDMRQQFLRGALAKVPIGRPLVQFSYGVKAPIEVDDPKIKVSRSRWVIKNLPPTRVWNYSYVSDEQ